MERVSREYNGSMVSSSKMVALDYLFNENDQIKAYQLVRFAAGEPWLILEDGLLLCTIEKKLNIWLETTPSNFDRELLDQIGVFIDKQHFNFLPDKIKTHWHDAVQEVIMQSDSAYLVVCKENVEFNHFKNVFSAFIAELIEEEWSVEFKVYNASFSDEFIVRVF